MQLDAGTSSTRIAVFGSFNQEDDLPVQIGLEAHLVLLSKAQIHLHFLIMHLANLGYALISRDDNPLFPYGSELSFLRVERPPKTSQS